MLVCGVNAFGSQSPFYYFMVIPVAPGGGSFNSFDGSISINDSGNVAFTGRDALGQGVFFARRSIDANDLFTWTTEAISRGDLESVSLNNHDQFATVFQTTTAPRIATVRRYSYGRTGTWTSESVAKGGDVRDQYGRYIYPFLNILPGVSMNDQGYVTFIGQDIYNYALTRLVQKRNLADPTPTGLAVPLATAPEGTTLSDRRMLVRTGSILVWNPDYTLSEGIASSGAGFTVLGERPGCTDNGDVVAFYGELPDPGRAEFFTLANHDVVPLPVTPGPGIFASVWVNGARHIVRVAGAVNNGYLDPGERRPVGTWKSGRRPTG